VVEIIAFVENRETARNADKSQTVLVISSYRRSTNKQHNGQAERDNIDLSRTSTCPDM